MAALLETAEDRQATAAGPRLAVLRPSLWLAGAGVVSVLLLVPCFWQSRIQAGDLSSHVYNAWLSLLVEQGKAGGLAVVPQWTNVLFDVILRFLIKAGGADAAQRIAVSATVLTFFWGAFALASAVARRRAWFMTPCLAMLAYGWAFHKGFFNFYLSLGICLWAWALVVRKRTRLRLAAASLLLLLALLAHAQPVAWTLAVAGYAALALRLSPRFRLLLAGAALAVIVALRIALVTGLETAWAPEQILFTTGADQSQYFFAVAGLLLFWSALIVRHFDSHQPAALWRSIPLQVFVLTGAGIALIPSRILFPMFPAPVFALVRMSLALGVLACAWLGVTLVRKREFAFITAIAIGYFSLLYADTQRINAIEDQVESLLKGLPPGQRVISALCDTSGISYHLLHIVDRACVGRCFSYANYEAASGQFSLRATGANPVVLSRHADVIAVESGTYVVTDRDAPLYQVFASAGAEPRFQIRSLRPGDIAAATCFESIPLLKGARRSRVDR
ncbi:MAG: hypothetical protein AAB225_06425 [Acidobacteriota bacterium]